MYRNDAQRFVVTLPINEKLSNLGNFRQIATKRFYNLERKLQQNGKLREQYKQFMAEYMKLKHMSLIKWNPQQTDTEYYLPHHAVVKENSLTTKLCVVFDGSAKSHTGLSLNDALLVGPTVQDDLFSILLRFRTRKYLYIQVNTNYKEFYGAMTSLNLFKHTNF